MAQRTDKVSWPTTLAFGAPAIGAGYGAATSGDVVSSFCSACLVIPGVIVSVIIMAAIPYGSRDYCSKVGFAHFNCGLSVGICGLAGGLTIAGLSKMFHGREIKLMGLLPPAYQASGFAGQTASLCCRAVCSHYKSLTIPSTALWDGATKTATRQPV